MDLFGSGYDRAFLSYKYVMNARCILNAKNTCALKELRLESCFSPREEKKEEEELNRAFCSERLRLRLRYCLSVSRAVWRE